MHLLPGFLFPEPASDSHTDSVPMTLSELPGPAVPVLLLASEIQILPEFLMLPVIQASSEESDYHRNLVPAMEDLAPFPGYTASAHNNKQIASYIGINIPRTLWIIAILWDVSLW